MPLDLEEQEQLDQLKAFWQKYRNLITGVLTAALFAYAAYSGYQWWRTSQASAASQLYETMVSAINKGDKDQTLRAADALQKQFPYFNPDEIAAACWGPGYGLLGLAAGLFGAGIELLTFAAASLAASLSLLSLFWASAKPATLNKVSPMSACWSAKLFFKTMVKHLVSWLDGRWCNVAMTSMTSL